MVQLLIKSRLESTVLLSRPMPACRTQAALPHMLTGGFIQDCSHSRSRGRKPNASLSLSREKCQPHHRHSTHSAAASAAEQPQLIRIFVLGPSHHVYLAGCALSQASHYATPLGQLVVDTSIVSGLMVHQDSTDDDADGYADADAPLFELMSTRVDEAEHSIELHLPYIAKIVNDLRAKFAASEESESALPRPPSAERNSPPTLTQSPPEMTAAAATAAAAGPSPTPSTVGDATTDRKRRRNEDDEDQSAFARPRPRSAADHRRLSVRRELHITIVPVLVGSLTAKMQSRYGKVCGVI